MTRLLLYLSILFLSGSTTAQTLKVGLKGGLNSATIAGPEVDLNSRKAFHFGVVSEFLISDRFSVQPEFLYSSQGAKGMFGSNEEAELKLNYFAIPIFVKYYLFNGLSLEIAPQIGFLSRARFKDNNSEEYDVTNSYNTLDFGFNLGLSYGFDNGFNLGLHYYHGLTDISYFGSGFSDEAKIYNSVIQFSIGYYFLKL